MLEDNLDLQEPSEVEYGFIEGDVPEIESPSSTSPRLLNKQRDEEVAKITVTLTNGVVLDGDEKSQNRITRAIAGLPDDTTTQIWIDADGVPQELTKPDFQEALQLAGNAQTQIFADYAQKKYDLLNPTV